MQTPTQWEGPKRLDQVRDLIRLKHYSIRTEQAYLGWIRRFILFHNQRHPRDLGQPEVEAFLTHLAVREKVASSTQNQALNAVLFLYCEVLKQDLGGREDVTRAKRPARLPVVLTVAEVQAVLARLEGYYGLLASLLYGSGLRLMEGVRLRVTDLELTRREIIVRDGKGFTDSITMLPEKLIQPLQTQLVHAKALQEQDLREGCGAVYLPYALERQYPGANREWVVSKTSLFKLFFLGSVDISKIAFLKQ